MQNLTMSQVSRVAGGVIKGAEAVAVEAGAGYLGAEGGAEAGAELGAEIGFIGGPAGSVIGGFIGAVVGGVAGYEATQHL